ILTPVLSDDQMKEAVAKFEKVLTDQGAEIVNVENWGLKKMAYPIQKKSTGFYSLIEFKGEPTIVSKLETAYRRDEKVIRFITVKLDKYSAAYAEKRRNKFAKKEEE
ncbi:MAG: 30S ribosomal protein S6, partial [Prevotella sp.]|nr:30S ribosomal protein S6 [Prevotella sp.]